MAYMPKDKSADAIDNAYDFAPMPIGLFAPIGQDSEGNTHIPSMSNQLRDMLPAFLHNAPTGIGLGPQHSPGEPAVAEVTGWGTGIQVHDSNLFSKSVMAHEATHTFQNTRENQAPVIAGDYNYGGINGLLKATADRKTINDFSSEQQAAIVEDWYQLNQAVVAVYAKQGGHLTPQQARYFEAKRNVFQPFIAQLANQTPQSDADKDYTKDVPAQRVPGLPPGDVVGLTEPSPQMGGPPMRVK